MLGTEKSSSGAGARPPARPGAPSRPNVHRPAANSISVNRCQEGNKVLSCLRNVPWQYADIVADYEVGATTCALFLSLKYHRLHPEYIHQRIEKIQGKYNLRILLVMCDVGDQHVDPIRELTKTCLINNLTIMVAWTAEEAAAYLQMYKAYEHKSPDSIKERVENDYSSLLRAALTTIKGVNKTDVMTLRTNFGSMASIAAATAEDLSLCPGLGGVKVRRIKDAFEKPFRNSPGEAVGTQRNTGEERASASSTQLPSSSIARASTSTARLAPAESTRESPPWDLEHGLNSPPPASPNRTTETALASAPPTSDRFSPEWDIEDDNESLGVSSPPAKRLRPSTS